MNRPLFLAPTSTEWDCVTGMFYIAEPKDFPEGCGVVLDATTGRQWGIGKNKLGLTVRLELYVPLCNGCDSPIARNGVCDNCCLIHTDIAGAQA